MNLLSDFPDHIADEYEQRAKQLQIADLWEDYAMFTDLFSTCPALDPVMAHLFVAMNPQTAPSERLARIRMAREALEDFATEHVSDDYIKLVLGDARGTANARGVAMKFDWLFIRGRSHEPDDDLLRVMYPGMKCKHCGTYGRITAEFIAWDRLECAR